MTGFFAFWSNSVLFAPSSPHTLPGILDHGELHAEADAEEGDLVRPCIRDGPDFPLDAPLPEPSRNKHAVDVLEVARDIVLLSQAVGVDINPVHPGFIGQAGMFEGLVQALVGIGELDILAHHRDIHLARCGCSNVS